MRTFTLLILLLVSLALGVEPTSDSAVTPQISISSVDTTATPDSTSSVLDSIKADVAVPVDTSQSDTVQAAATVSATPVDTIDQQTVEVTENKDIAATSSVKKIKLRKRKFNYRQQVVLAVGMMAFIAIMMTTAQSLNPK